MFARIKAIVLSHLIRQRRDFNRICEIIIWPVFDLFIWGFMSVWIMRGTGDMNAASIPLYGIFFWQVVFAQASQGISLHMLDEFFGKNLTSLISSPLTVYEWLLGLMIMGVLRVCAVFMVGALFLKLFFGASIFLFGTLLLPLIMLMLLAGWAFGLLTGCLIFIWGNRASAFIWATWMFTAFCGVFGPLDVMPYWIQKIGMCLPMTYPIMIAQQYLVHGTVVPDLMYTGFVLNVLWFCGALLAFFLLFTRAKYYGLNRLQEE